MPHVRRDPQPHNEQNGLAAALFIPINSRPPIFNQSHDLPLKAEPKASWISRIGSAEVYAKGVLEVTTPPGKAVPGRIPCTLKVLNPSVRPNNGLTSLFTLAKLVRFARLNPSAVNCSFVFSPILCCQVKRASKS